MRPLRLLAPQPGAAAPLPTCKGPPRLGAPASLGRGQPARTTTTTTTTTTRTRRLQFRCRPARTYDDCTRMGPFPTLAADYRWDRATVDPLLPRRFPASCVLSSAPSPAYPPPQLPSECPSGPPGPGTWDLVAASLPPSPPFPCPPPLPCALVEHHRTQPTAPSMEDRFHNPQPADTFHDYDYELASVSPARGPLHSCFCTGRLARRRKSYDRHCSGCPARLPSAYSVPGNTALDGPGPHACTSAPTTGPPSGLGDGDSPPCHESEPVDEDLEVELDLSPSPLHDPELHSSWQPTSPTFSPVGSPPDSDSPSDDPVPSRTRSEPPSSLSPPPRPATVRWASPPAIGSSRVSPRLADHPIADPCKPFPGEAGLATDTPPLLPPV